MGRIAILPDAVADQIAAGEVVERPASVVKELVENALDAGASVIEIELEAGGRTLISVADDGSGMDRDDAVMAMDRHATSKVVSASDLVGVPTYGFRGEALPSIASVSKFELETAGINGEHRGVATRVLVSGGRMTAVEESTRRPGTTVTVRRLFFNAPARRKFLRSQRAETRAAVQAVTVLALARLDVTFRLRSDGKDLLDAPQVSSAIERVEALFGRELADTLIPVEGLAGSVTVRGLVQRPADARPAGRRAFLFVNGRPFRDPFIVRASEAGYRATIHPGARPSMILDISVPGDAVDVNVHPAKLEVRFRDKRFVEHAVEEAVRESLGEMHAAAVSWAPRGEAPFDPGTGEGRTGGSSASGRPGFAPGDPGFFDAVTVSAQAETLVEAAGGRPPERGAVLQLFNTYLLLETPEGLAIVDQHSAHERVIYERTMANLEAESAGAQRLLLPLTLELNADELQMVDEFRDSLSAVGFEVEPFGGRSVVLHAVPNPHPRFDARRCFEEMVADLARGRFGGWTNQLERFAATYACRAAVKAGQPLDDREIRVLLDALFACTLPPHDVHGRPTIVQLPRQELERRFGRS